MKKLKVFQKVRGIRRQILYVLSAVVLVAASSAPVFASPTFSNHLISSSYANPGQVTVAGGSLWYIETTASNPSYATHIGKMTASGTTTDYDIRTLSGNASFSLRSLTTGSDGNVWFNGNVSTTVYTGFLNISTGTVTLYPSGVPSYGNFGPIVTGSDGNLWYYVKSANNNYSYLVSINPTTGTGTTAYTFDTYANLTSIASGPDGNLWVTDAYYNRVSSITTSGTAGGSYTVPTSSSNPASIIAGPDGNLWLIEESNGKITKLSTSGSFTEYAPAFGISPGRLVAGPDAVWFIDGASTKKIGRITSSGSITEYTIPGTGVSDVNGMTLGPDNAMWFSYTDSSGAKLGSITTTPFFDNHPISSSYANPGQVTIAGGSLWYLETTASNPSYNTHIGNMTTSGTTVDYNIRTLSGQPNFSLRSLTTGSDGNVWFNGNVSSTVYTGRLDISTGVVTLYASSIPSYGNFGRIVTGSDGNLWYYVKSANNNYSYLVSINSTTGTTTTGYTFDTYSNLTSIASGPDGRLWVTDAYYNRVFAKDPTSGTSSYNIPGSGSYPGGITSGLDGNLWFTRSGKFLKLTTSGSFTEYTPPAGVSPGSLAAGPDGAVWFIDNASVRKIGRITSVGSITEYTVPGSSIGYLNSMTLGPDGAVWFSYTDSGGAKLGRLGY